MSKQDPNSDKKTLVLDGATEVLRKQGLQALTFDNVATEAGLSRQLVRYYYPSLEGLMVDLCDHLAATYREVLVVGVQEIGQVERLDFFLDFFFGVADRHPMPNNLEVYDAFFAFAVGSTQLRDRLCSTYEMLGQVFLHELSIAHPNLEDFVASELSFVFVSMMHAHWSYVATLGYSDEHGRITRAAMNRLIDSYLGQPPESPAVSKTWRRQT